MVGEQEMAVQYLDYLRASVIRKVEDLDDAVARRPMVPSGISLLWLITHLTMAEQWWFQVIYAGQVGDGIVRDPDPSEDDTVASAIAGYRAACAANNAIVAGGGHLDELAPAAPGDDRPEPSRRWILVHMIEETARHAGHADILRELLDGSVGR